MRVASRRTVTNELRARVREELITALAAADDPDAVLEVASNHCASRDLFLATFSSTSRPMHSR